MTQSARAAQRAGALGSLLGSVLAESGFLLAFGAAGGLVVAGAACVLGGRWVGSRSGRATETDAKF